MPAEGMVQCLHSDPVSLHGHSPCLRREGTPGVLFSWVSKVSIPNLEGAEGDDAQRCFAGMHAQTPDKDSTGCLTRKVELIERSLLFRTFPNPIWTLWWEPEASALFGI